MKRIIILVLSIFIITNAQAQEIHPKTQAQLLAKEGKHHEALNKINSLIIETPFIANYHTFKAECLINLNEVDKALTAMNFAIKMMPDSAFLYQTRGLILQAYGLYDVAIMDYNKILELEPNNKALRGVTLSNRGNCKSATLKHEDALKDLQTAHALVPNDLAIMNNLAKTLDELGKQDEAMKYLEMILAKDTMFVEAYVNYGFIYQTQNDHEKAVKYFDKAQKLAPMEAFIYSNRAFSKLKLNDLKKAWRDVNTSIQLNPRNSYAYKIRALISLAKEDMKSVCIDLENALKLGYAEQYGDEVEKLKAEHCKEAGKE